MKKIPYLKMQGAGNDFIMLDNRQLKLDPALFPALARRLCCRRLSVGADGLMVADAPEHGGDLKMYFFNSGTQHGVGKHINNDMRSEPRALQGGHQSLIVYFGRCV